MSDVRSACLGTAPLRGRLEPWLVDLCQRPAVIADWLELHGSPVNIIDPRPMARNAAELEAVGAGFELDFRVYFARKANKALALVAAARELGLGVDLASERELRQVLALGVEPGDLVMTAAVKPAGLLELCLDSGTTVVADNNDELRLLAEIARRSGRRTPVALRLAPRPRENKPETRFGFSHAEAIAAAERHLPVTGEAGPGVAGVHFHLDGYAANDRVAAIGEAIELIDALRERGHEPAFLDIGGGIPMSYLESGAEWKDFWVRHRRGLLGDGDSLTFDRHDFGLNAHGSEVIGQANIYPYFQEPVRGRWLEQVLGSELVVGGFRTAVGDAIRSRGLQLRCEPGRSLVDGCGMTAARVEFRKPRRDGSWLIGLAMNRTQCRSTSDDFLVDPLLLRPDNAQASENTGPIEGYLVGAYCIERELLTWRRLSFPHGVEVGDVVVFPNSAGYLMHILESSSHQIPLARNLIVEGQRARLDQIDAEKPA